MSEKYIRGLVEQHNILRSVNFNDVIALAKCIKDDLMSEKEYDRLVATRKLIEEFHNKQDVVNDHHYDPEHFSVTCDVEKVKHNNKQYFLLNELQSRLAQIWL